MISPCGMYCEICLRFKAMEDKELREFISENKKIPINDAACMGCRKINNDRLADKPEECCKIYRCAYEKNLEYCYECELFPCEILNTIRMFIGNNLSYIKILNLNIISDIGTEKFKELAEKNSSLKKLIPECPIL